MKNFKYWIQASRLASQSYIFLPILLGQAYWVFLGNAIDWLAFALIHLFGLFNQLYIVYANDFADFEDDKKNEMPTMFSGGSRVLVENLLPRNKIKAAAIIMASLCVTVGLGFTLVYEHIYMIPLIIIALLLLWLYSYRPVRLSYRGGGEVLQTLGTGIVLPLLGFYAQSGTLASFPWIILLAVLPTSYACAIATAVPDEPADRSYGKNTMPVLMGASNAKALIIVLNIISTTLFYVLLEPFRSVVLSVLFFSLPPASIILSLVYFRAKAGTKGISIFGFSAILTTLSVIGGMGFNYFGH
jgi:1,4-dihydroxy-2-naphthoate polyprenyltransferase